MTPITPGMFLYLSVTEFEVCTVGYIPVFSA